MHAKEAGINASNKVNLLAPLPAEVRAVVSIF
jgi:hypothetical protein